MYILCDEFPNEKYKIELNTSKDIPFMLPEGVEDKVIKTIKYSSGVVITGNTVKINLDE